VLHAGNAAGVRARIVVEGANGPTTPAADEILGANGILVVPDILANAGGGVVSYFAWVSANQAYWWNEKQVEDRLAERMLATWDAVRGYALREGLNLRDAATTLAVQRVADAHTVRGLYP
jgi:glutamate dehydrogenase (NAD(P)+)